MKMSEANSKIVKSQPPPPIPQFLLLEFEADLFCPLAVLISPHVQAQIRCFEPFRYIYSFDRFQPFKNKYEKSKQHEFLGEMW
jgi:hypothetical protein